MYIIDIFNAVNSLCSCVVNSQFIFLTQLYCYIPKIFKMNVSNRFLSSKSPFELFSSCEFTKVIL